MLHKKVGISLSQLNKHFNFKHMTNDNEIVKRSTIKDVAREANVSIKTVSRVVRQEPNVREKTRSHVQEVMKKLNYRPTISARSTVSSRSFLLGLLIHDLNPYIYELFNGTQLATRANGYHLIVETIDSNEKDIHKVINDLIVQSNLDGIIISAGLCDNIELLRALENLNTPFARIAASTAPEIGFSVTIDDRAAAQTVTQHLIDLGHRGIGFIKGKAEQAATIHRYRGFCDAMDAAGIPIREEFIFQGDFNFNSGLEAGLALLDREERPTAIFASNDNMAAGLVMAAYKLNISIPEQLSVVGFDGSELSTAIQPQLTTIKQPVLEMARQATERIIEYIRQDQKGRIPNEELQYELLIRQSTDSVK